MHKIQHNICIHLRSRLRDNLTICFHCEQAEAAVITLTGKISGHGKYMLIIYCISILPVPIKKVEDQRWTCYMWKENDQVP